MRAYEDDFIISSYQAAELLLMNVQLVRKYATEGRIPGYRLPGGRAFKFFRRELLHYVSQHPIVPRDCNSSS